MDAYTGTEYNMYNFLFNTIISDDLVLAEIKSEGVIRLTAFK